ncbi:MAG: hypothetical protein IH851_09795 [Armatimonadetes bacterium]|nr:hypothetical protein [Armatimonadota bacterium]
MANKAIGFLLLSVLAGTGCGERPVDEAEQTASVPSTAANGYHSFGDRDVGARFTLTLGHPWRSEAEPGRRGHWLPATLLSADPSMNATILIEALPPLEEEEDEAVGSEPGDGEPDLEEVGLLLGVWTVSESEDLIEVVFDGRARTVLWRVRFTASSHFIQAEELRNELEKLMETMRLGSPIAGVA